MPRGSSASADAKTTEPIELDVPDFKATLRVGDELVVRWKKEKRATAVDVQLRRREGFPLADERSVEGSNRTEFSHYPLGPVGIPEVRVRAVCENGLSEWSPWVAATHDLGGGD